MENDDSFDRINQEGKSSFLREHVASRKTWYKEYKKILFSKK